MAKTHSLVLSGIEESPPWRLSKSSELMEDVIKWQCDLEQPPKYDTRHFYHFIHQTNIGEDLGTQAEEETKYICENPPKPPLSTSVKETLSTFEVLHKLLDIHKEMEGTGMITVQIICDLHKTLMKNLHHNAGNIRNTVTYTIMPDGKKHYYTPPDQVESQFYTVIDHHNECMEELLNLTNLTRKQKLCCLVEAAAQLLFNFVSIHPFSDGNGRMSRLLAGYVMMIVNPFPVQPYHSRSNSYRKDYIDAIVYCCKDPKKYPSRIAALLVDGLHDSWNEYTKSHKLVVLMFNELSC